MVILNKIKKSSDLLHKKSTIYASGP